MQNELDDFIKDYNDIKSYLLKVSNLNYDASLPKLIDATSNNPVISKNKNLLKGLHKLRNIIVHECSDRYPEIAKVTEYSIKTINKIARHLLDPIKVTPLFQKKVYILQYGNSISEAVKIMHDRNFSQIPLYKEKEFEGLLTTNAIVRWLGSCILEEICDLKDTSINYVFENYTECKENYVFIGKGSTLFEVIEKFREFENRGKRLDAIFITEKGNKKESLLGIITVWDLPELNKRLD